MGKSRSASYKRRSRGMPLTTAKWPGPGYDAPLTTARGSAPGGRGRAEARHGEEGFLDQVDVRAGLQKRP